ncbi:FAD-binding dehydrogenase [Falsarthrobacter nasiphocae]|uniref:Oxidoreductase n=1 Tax=Falsarthrobacter nasiphocae TaxID=189863 RepID=A0AAE3YF25_9MICC|nr:FAD-binding dehydrogenase [Falsarthrobacter nasiphocae]MDR6892050.1 putative oxidoreductase [Falsarthrobacter nasiphocae]
MSHTSGSRTSSSPYDLIVIGAGLAGLTAAAEAAEAGLRVAVLEQEGPQSLGGQAFWSFGGLFLVDSPEQRRLGIKDSAELAWQDWEGSAGFDRPEDHWPREWAKAYVEWAAGPKREWLKQQGHRLFPVVGWAERGSGLARSHGNSVPRFHITWGTGPELVEVLARRCRAQEAIGRLDFLFRHQVDEILTSGGAVAGVKGTVLAHDDAPRGTATSREPAGEFELSGPAVVVATGGIGGSLDAVRAAWPERLGAAPKDMVAGVPAYVDGRGIQIARQAGGAVINEDRMWHYVEGIKNWDPVWKNHGIRILPGPSSLWLDATGRRLPVPLFPGFDTLGTLEHLRTTGHDHSWFVLTPAIIAKEFALSGQEQNPDLTGKSVKAVLSRATQGIPGPVQAFLDHGEDFVQADTVEDLVRKMQALEGGEVLDGEQVALEIEARDREIANPFTKDLQVTALRGARNYIGDRLIRTAKPHRLLDPEAGGLIAVKLHVLTRKTLGGLHTDLGSRVLGHDGEPVPGLYAAGEAAGFGGGGVHGYRSLEGTFLGGCLFSGLRAGRDVIARS